MMKKKPFSSSLEKHTLAKDYLVLGTTGEGSFGQVKVALHRVTNTMVAIKILERDLGMDYMISSEVNLLKSLHHPHIIQLLQVIETRHVTYLVMEYASQGPLKKTVTKCGHLKEEEARTLFKELTSAIKYIHSRNIAHRDIKPDNILLDWEGHVKLSDFGLGRRLVPGEKVRGFWGTRDYCAPEVFGQTDYEGLPPDIWSLGVVLYFLVTGHLPFRETEYSNIQQAIISRNCCIPPHLSPELQDLLNCLMTVDPTKRPPIREVIAHTWLCHDEDILNLSEETPTEPESNIVWEMFFMGYKIQEIKEALREQKYNNVMATYLLVKKKSTQQHQFHHTGGLGGTMDPAKAPDLPLPVRAYVSTLSTFSLPTLLQLPKDESKVCSRRHSLPTTPKCRLTKSSSEKFERLREIQSNMECWFPSSSTTIPPSSLSLLSSPTTIYSVNTCSATANFEENEERSESLDTGTSTSSQETICKNPFPSEETQEESTGTGSLRDRSPSSRKKSLQKHLQGQFQGVPRVPQQGWKVLKKRICQALCNLCCCIPVAKRQRFRKTGIMAANEEGCSDTG